MCVIITQKLMYFTEYPPSQVGIAAYWPDGVGALQRGSIG